MGNVHLSWQIRQTGPVYANYQICSFVGSNHLYQIANVGSILVPGYLFRSGWSRNDSSLYICRSISIDINEIFLKWNENYCHAECEIFWSLSHECNILFQIWMSNRLYSCFRKQFVRLANIGELLRRHCISVFTEM